MKALHLRLGLIGVILAIFLIKFISVSFFGPSDDKLVREALDRAIVASREGRPGGVLESLTSHFKMNSDMPGGAQIANFIKDSHPDVTVENYDAIINGDTARITSPVRVKVSFMGHDFDQRVENVSMVFKREDGHVWLIIPARDWKLEQVFVPEELTPSGNGFQN